MSVQLVRFAVGDVPCAIDIMQVREVIHAGSLTPVPGTPAFVEGLIELRGDFLPVVDVRRRLNASPAGGAKIIIARARERRVGLLVDQVFAVFRVAADAIRPVDAVAASPMLRGIVRDDAGVVMVIDPDGLLTELEASQLDEL